MTQGEGVTGDLTEREVEILKFLRRRYASPSARAQAIHDLFGISATAFFQQVNVLIDKPAAVAYDPTLVNRWRRMREKVRREHFRRRANPTALRRDLAIIAARSRAMGAQSS